MLVAVPEWPEDAGHELHSDMKGEFIEVPSEHLKLMDSEEPILFNFKVWVGFYSREAVHAGMKGARRLQTGDVWWKMGTKMLKPMPRRNRLRMKFLPRTSRRVLESHSCCTMD